MTLQLHSENGIVRMDPAGSFSSSTFIALLVSLNQIMPKKVLFQYSIHVPMRYG